MTHAESTLILASASPRRRELLRYLTPQFRMVTTTAEEDDHSDPPPAVVAALPPVDVPLATHPTLLAWRKAHAACNQADPSVIIGADTIVVLGQTVMGKPTDAAHAHRLLRALAGRTHTVYTGVVLMDGRAGAEQRTQYALVASAVTISPLSDQEIAAYVATGEPLDKAGAYGIQGLGGRLVQTVAGSYTNVVGLPLVALHRMLCAVGTADLAEPSAAYHRWLQDQGKEPLPCPPTDP